MASYTIEDIEILRKKSGMTYQEAVALLDYHDGNLARALIDLEKNGRLKEEPKMENASRAYTGHSETKQNETKQKALNILQKLYMSRVKVSKGKTTVLNFSVLFGALCLIFAPHMTIFGFILSLILGYQFSFTKQDEEFASENLEKMVKNAAQNAKSSVSSAVQSFTDDKKGNVVTETFDKTKEAVKSTVSDAKAKVTEKMDTKPDEDPAEALKDKQKRWKKPWIPSLNPTRLQQPITVLIRQLLPKSRRSRFPFRLRPKRGKLRLMTIRTVFPPSR